VVQHTLHSGYEQQQLDKGDPACLCKLCQQLAHFYWHQTKEVKMILSSKQMGRIVTSKKDQSIVE
jgi:hypothetical protein